MESRKPRRTDGWTDGTPLPLGNNTSCSSLDSIKLLYQYLKHKSISAGTLRTSSGRRHTNLILTSALGPRLFSPNMSPVATNTMTSESTNGHAASNPDLSSPSYPGYPHPDPCLSFWLLGSRSSPLLGHRTTQNLPEEAEVAIIGSGMRCVHEFPLSKTKSSNRGLRYGGGS